MSLPGGPTLSVLRAGGHQRSFVLVHGLASNARLWEPVAERLSEAGHAVAAVDLRGHGQSEQPDDGYDTTTCATDVTRLIHHVDWIGPGAPIVVGQSWGAHVALATAHAAARANAAIAGVVCVDGGWIALSRRYDTFQQCWRALAPPDLSGARYADVKARMGSVTGSWPPGSLDLVMGSLAELPGGGVRNHLSRDHHRDILHSLWTESLEAPPRRDVRVPALLLVAGDPADEEKAQAVDAAVRQLPQATVEWFPGAHHDMHAEQPDVVSKSLLRFAQEVAT